MKAQERKSIEADATKKAYIYVISGAYARENRWSHRSTFGDQRTLWGKTFNSALKAYADQYAEIGRKANEKHIERYTRRHTSQEQIFCFVKDNSMWKDYQSHRMYFDLKVFGDHLQFGSRNHWAKTAQESRVLKAIINAKAKSIN